MLNKFTSAFMAAGLAAVTVFTSGCSPQPNHPNQLNRFDGAAFDSLVLAHGSLVSLRTSVQDRYPNLAPAFNKTADAYRMAVAAYTAYRVTGATELTLSNSLHKLTFALVALEGQLEANLHRTEIQNTASRLEGQASYIPSDLFSVLQLAASIASFVPATQGEAEAAGALLAAAHQALSEWRTVSKAPINLDWLSPVEPIS